MLMSEMGVLSLKSGVTLPTMSIVFASRQSRHILTSLRSVSSYNSPRLDQENSFECSNTID